MKLKIQTQYTQNSTTYEKDTGKSQTVPDETLTIPQIIERHVKGLPIYATNRTPYYDSENDFGEIPDLNSMDLSEKADYFRENAQRIAELKAKFQGEESKRKSDFMYSEFKKRYEDEQKEQKTNSNTVDKEPIA